MRIVLDFGRCFVNTRAIDDIRTALFGFCNSGRWTDEGFDLLLRRGASIDDRGFHGRTCLHLCFYSFWVNSWYGGPSDWVQRLRNGLVSLIQHGADVFATDYCGSSVSSLAYDIDCDDGVFIGSLKGDVWDNALVHCGYKISDFRRGYPRRAASSQHYTRREFEGIWAGCEHLCPYYDDEFSVFDCRLRTTDEEHESDYTTSDSDDGGAYLDDAGNDYGES